MSKEKETTKPVQASPAADVTPKSGSTSAPGGGKVLPFQRPSAVSTALSGHCKAEECKKKSVRADFCDEHYGWFKEGLITMEGFHAKDFEKKYLNFMKRKAA